MTRRLERAHFGRNAFHRQGLHVHGLVGQAVGGAVPQGVLEPLFVVTAQGEFWVVGRVLIVVHSVCATAFLAGSGRHHGGLGHFDQVVHFQRFHAGGVPHFGLIGQGNATDALADFGNLGHAFVHALLCTEHASVLLHGLADVASQVLCVDTFFGVVQLVEALQRALAAVGRHFSVFAKVFDVRSDVLTSGFTKHQQVQQRVGAQTVGAVHRHGSAFAHCVQAVDNVVLLAVPGHHLAVDVGGNATHLIVNGRHHRDRFLGDVHVGEVVADLFHRRQTLADGLCTQVVQLHQDVVLVGTAAATFLDFLVHGARHEVARSQVLRR